MLKIVPYSSCCRGSLGLSRTGRLFDKGFEDKMGMGMESDMVMRIRIGG